jgi:endonuclease/exonuclease/phosphatase (EEP) superfamily protein YafD
MLVWMLSTLASMAYPAALTLLLITAALFLIRRSHYRLTFGLLSLLAAPLATLGLALSLGLALPTNPPPRTPNTLRIAHLNTYIPNLQYAGKLAFIAGAQADIISLEELHTDLTALIRKNPPLPYHILSTDITKPYHLPMMLLSRWPITHIQSFGPRLELYRINRPQTPFYVLQIHPHAPHNAFMRYARNNQWATLATAKLPTPLIMVGDNNTTPWDPALQPLKSQLTFANHLPTWPAVAPLTPIDNLATTPGLPPPTITRLKIPGADHLALIADFPH